MSFNYWVRHHPQLGSLPHEAALSVTDLDFVFHKYIVTDSSNGRVLPRQHLMIVEQKSFNKTVPAAQHDTLNVMHQVLKASNQTIVKAKRGYVKIFYHGCHLVSFSGHGHFDSKYIRWNDRAITLATLAELLLFGRNPHTLIRRQDRLHHKKHPALSEDWLGAPTEYVA